MLAFPTAPPHHMRTRHKASASKRKSPFFFRPQDSTQLTFFKFPEHASGHSHPLINLSLGFLFWNLWTTHPPHVCTSTPVLKFAHKLTCVLSWKVLSLTKPKGKIYKTKSLGHYITHMWLFMFMPVGLRIGLFGVKILKIL